MRWQTEHSTQKYKSEIQKPPKQQREKQKIKNENENLDQLENE